ncbi:GlxA family transcriptional regulator [Jiella mangrovi]|uniref:GlxA family transcriptional regulator n=1 Tax=Jiella mangrovi TaxID=2821407 RepID=A0ABS4BM66_9HYPH|nr:GlxA family transcriptional regulator [Jiella mangrovi]MBP0617822.1 GlxA family transcriptional regulator [Jiella mangrovi]
MPHTIAFYVHQGHQLLDLAGPLDAFHAANTAASRPLYATSVLSISGGEVCGGTGLPIGTHPATEASVDTLIVVGGRFERLRDADEVAMVRRLASAATRIASVCTGAFLLGEAGVLNGRRATTHWSRTNELQRSFPSASVEPDRIFVADGPVWTSAGITAGIDLALALIEADHGTDLARTVSRELVVYHRRPGGQSQFSALSLLEPDADRMRMALAFAREHLAEPLPLDRLAEAARLSPRQFGRAFRHATGETPAKAVERLRVEAARLRLEEGMESIELIARSVGFGDPERMRRAFVKRIGLSPQAVRQTVRPLSGGRAVG